MSGVERMDLEVEKSGAMVVNRAFMDPLRRAGLDRTEALLDYRGGEIVWVRGEERTIERLTLDTAEGAVTCYLKRHVTMSWRECLSSMIRLRRPISPGRREWENILMFRGAGLPTMIPVAAGDEAAGLRQGRSFSLTLEIEKASPLDRFLEENLSAAGIGFKRRLIDKVADIARRMHSAGFSHRDFYLCHLFIRPLGDRDAALNVIDLQRVGRRSRVTRHRQVKDLSALNFSAPPTVVTRTDRLRFLLAYLDLKHLDARARRLAASVARKTRRIARHHEKTVQHREREWIRERNQRRGKARWSEGSKAS